MWATETRRQVHCLPRVITTPLPPLHCHYAIAEPGVKSIFRVAPRGLPRGHWRPEADRAWLAADSSHLYQGTALAELAPARPPHPIC